MLIRIANKGEQAGEAVELGRCLPATAHMAERWTMLDLLDVEDKNLILSILPSAEITQTKSGRFFRLQNFDAFKAAWLNRLASNSR